MNFAELRFWGLLGAGLGIILLLRALLGACGFRRWELYDRVALASLGLGLLAAVSWLTFGIFVCVLLTTYFGLTWLVHRPAAQRVGGLALLLVVTLLPLVYFKYADFAANRVLGLGWNAVRDLAIPVGISFYTFQKVAFILDTLAFKRPLPRFLDFLNFAAFFPQIVAGPIERRDDLLPQLERFTFRWQPRMLDEGASWIAVGMFLKLVLADNLAGFVDREPTANAYLIWLANLVFGLRIYFDFAGYSLIALGVARLLGVKLTLNFASPYCATSIVEFWRRWHITLSQWFRDYLYTPLGGGRVRWWWFNVLLVFVVSGIWHGAGWNFVIWGALHGLYLVINRLGRNRLQRWPGGSWAVTMLFVVLAWMPFYETRGPQLAAKFAALVSPAAYGKAQLVAALQHWDGGNRLVLGAFLLFAAGAVLVEALSLRRGGEPYSLFRRGPVLVLLVVLTVLMAPGVNNGFVYFAF